MRTLVVIAVLVAVTVAAPPKNHIFEECTYPNGTDTKIHVYNCDGCEFFLLRTERI